MLAKYILPWFGGAATTWIVCMLFFQVALLAGYGYAYALTRPMSVARQALAQIVLLALVLVLLPITPSDSWKPADGSDPTWRIVALLAATVGGPYVVLATTSPLITRWFASLEPSANPSRLFAISNLGSFLGLLSYPFAFEITLSSTAQTRLWSVAFVVYAILFALCAFVVWRARGANVERPRAEGGDGAPLAPGRVLRWIGLSALASVLLLATTNQVSQWSAVIPFLWIVPLALYLLTFVLAFGRQQGGDVRWYALAFLFLGALTLAVGRPDTPILFLGAFVLHALAMFAGCMVCHAQVVRMQPAPRQLPAFYLAMSVGGAIGGLIVALFAPVLFNDYYEFPLALAGAGALSLLIVWRERSAAASASGWLRPAGALGAAAIVAGLALTGWRELRGRPDFVDRERNFYGVINVARDQMDDPNEAMMVMSQSGVDQGSQFFKPERRMEPACVFNQASGFGYALKYHPKRRADPNAPLSIGVIGLGAGMMAGVTRPGDTLRYYEINPAVLNLANRHFTFLRDGKGKADVVLGDGRLVLERELRTSGSRRFDLLVIDAFRGASPPMHLITAEAFEMYLAHLAPGGVLAFNFDDATFEMGPLHRGLSKKFGVDVRWIETPEETGCEDPVSWAIYSNDRALWDIPEVKAAISPWRDNSDSTLVWTDASSNLMSIINWSELGAVQ